MPPPRRLTEDDRGALEDFLRPRQVSSVFLLANARGGGLSDLGVRPTGTYIGLFVGDELVAVAAHFWNRNVILQAEPEHVPVLLEALRAAAVRPLGGLLGPGEQVAAALAHLEVASAELQIDEPEGLYRLDLAALRLPEALTSGRLRGRRGTRRDLPTLARWRADFMIESLGHEPGAETEAMACESEESALERGSVWLVVDGGVPVAMAGFNARLSGLVQLGGVWTPPERRGRGYARAVVAAALQDAAAEGVGEAVLFTGEENVPAVRAYQSLGFERCGSYRITLLRQPRWKRPGPRS